MTRACFAFAGFILAVVAFACAWDRDTLAVELEGMPGVADVVAGRIDRNPDLYYEMRIERVLKEVVEDPVRLELYDDLGVAYDRLGDHDSAIDWMLRKGEQLTIVDMPSDHWDDAEYKRLANLGTFRIHKWFSEGADRKDVSLLEKGLDDLLRALEINPDAHFGREVVQVVMVQAILEPEKTEELFAPKLVLDEEVERFREGILGIMVLGEAWQSVDAFRLLKVFKGDRNQMLQLVIQRKIDDLVDQGGVGMLELDGLTRSDPIPEVDSLGVNEMYSMLVKNGNEYRNNRELFMGSKLRQGKHPDTDGDFWEGYEEVPPLDHEALMGDALTADERDKQFSRLVIGVGIGMFFLVVGLGFFGYRMTRGS